MHCDCFRYPPATEVAPLFRQQIIVVLFVIVLPGTECFMCLEWLVCVDCSLATLYSLTSPSELSLV